MAEMSGMNFASFDDMLLRLYDLKEELNTTFNSINSSIESLDNCYKTEAGNALVNSFRDFSKNNFPTVVDNIDCYIRDLKSAKENIQLFDRKLTEQLLDETLM